MDRFSTLNFKRSPPLNTKPKGVSWSDNMVIPLDEKDEVIRQLEVGP